MVIRRLSESLRVAQSLTLATGVFLCACAAPLRVNKLQDFRPESKNLVLLSSSQWDSKLRIAFAESGFKVLRFASQNTVIAQGGKDEIARVYDEAGARYGLSLIWRHVTFCSYNDSELINATLEVSDIKTNEVLLIIEKGGWTGPCLDPRGLVFQGLAEALAHEWKK